MFTDITLGQYYQTKSVLHDLDARVKLVGTFLYIITVFVCNSITAFIVAGLFLTFVIAISHVPASFMFKGLKGIAMLIIFTVAFNLFLTPGTVIWQYGVFHITKEGIRIAILMLLRLTLLISGTSILTLTTTPSNLTDGLESILGPFQKVGVPVHEVAMMMSIALRFIPILMEETDKIIKAQTARGADFETGNLFTRAKNMIPILVPLFVSAFRRASDLALAMEARCYQGGAGRTKMKPLHYEKRDGAAYVILVVYTTVICVITLIPMTFIK